MSENKKKIPKNGDGENIRKLEIEKKEKEKHGDSEMQ